MPQFVAYNILKTVYAYKLCHIYMPHRGFFHIAIKFGKALFYAPKISSLLSFCNCHSANMINKVFVANL